MTPTKAQVAEALRIVKALARESRTECIDTLMNGDTYMLLTVRMVELDAICRRSRRLVRQLKGGKK